MMTVAIAGHGWFSQSGVGRPKAESEAFTAPYCAVEDQPEDGGIGDLADYDRREEGEAEDTARAEQLAS